MSAKHNTTCAEASGSMGGDDWPDFDSLPRPVKAALWEACTNYHAGLVLDSYRRSLRRSHSESVAQTNIIREIKSTDREDIDLFAAEFRAKHGHDLPHVAARATIQRYDARRRA